jgi:hypothetical protein
MFTRKIFVGIAAVAAGTALLASASAGSKNLQAGSCFGTGGSTMAQTNGYGYTSAFGPSCSDHLRYHYPGWFGSYGYQDGTPTWSLGDIHRNGPSGTTGVIGSHNLCTPGYASCIRLYSDKFTRPLRELRT